MLIPEDFSEEQKKKVFVELPFCPKNEELSKTFFEKFHTFTIPRRLKMENEEGEAAL